MQIAKLLKHINNGFDEKLEEKSNSHFLRIANSDKLVNFYSLDVIISVGYRVKFARCSIQKMGQPNTKEKYVLIELVMNFFYEE